MEFDPDTPSLSQAFLAASFGVEVGCGLEVKV